MEYIFNSKTNCFETYVKQYDTKVDETTGEETQVLIPCTERLYTREEVDGYFAQCKGNKTLKSVNGLPTIVDRYTDGEYAIIFKTKRIAELKAKLKETDYQAIKRSEGRLTEEEYAPMSAQRQAWRDEIDALQKQIGE